MSNFSVGRMVLRFERIAIWAKTDIEAEIQLDFYLSFLRSNFQIIDGINENKWAGGLLCALDLLDNSQSRYGLIAARLQREVAESCDRYRAEHGRPVVPMPPDGQHREDSGLALLA